MGGESKKEIMPPSRRIRTRSSAATLAVALIVVGFLCVVNVFKIHSETMEAQERSFTAANLRVAALETVPSTSTESDSSAAAVNKLAEAKTAFPAENSAFDFYLDIREAALHKPACPLPVLQPEKYRAKYGWGKPAQGVNTCLSRKNERFLEKALRNLALRGTANEVLSKFRSEWENKPRFSTLLESSDDEGTIVFHNELCSRHGAVWEFGEIQDDEFQRMTSTLDAEDRQNFLRERFATNPENEWEGSHPPFVHRVHRVDANGRVTGLTAPYLIARCESESEVYIRAPWRDDSLRGRWELQRKSKRSTLSAETKKRVEKAHGLMNVLHIMFDSTSIQAQRRASKKIVSFLEGLNNAGISDKANRNISTSSYVFPFNHYHAVSCCSPGNQIPVYSGNMNGEGDPFVNAEPFADSKDWIWRVAEENGFKTFWALDNCPDKSARDYHAFPAVHSRVVAPVCIAGPLLSQKTLGCVGDKSVNELAIEGLRSFWQQHGEERKFAVAHFISPHEPTEKLLIELDETLGNYLEELQKGGVLEKTAIILWSDHGINFGPYASTPDGEIEKLFPFANVVLPRKFAKKSGLYPQLRHNMNMLTTPYDLYELTRRLLYYPSLPPPFSHDPSNPPLPSPGQSHIMASFKKKIAPIDLAQFNISSSRDCFSANIPVEFCTCLPWIDLPMSTQVPPLQQAHKSLASDKQVSFSHAEIGNISFFSRRVIEEHNKILMQYRKASNEFPSGQCQFMRLKQVTSFQLQRWPVDYQPKEKNSPKRVWAKPNRDMVRIVYEASGDDDASESGLFIAVFSVSQKTPLADVELARADRLDTMRSLCGVMDKTAEHLCICMPTRVANY